MFKLLVVSLAVFLCFSAIGLPLGALPLYVHDRLGYGALAIGFVMGTQSVATLLTRQLGGNLTDRRGGKEALLLGAGGCLASGLLYGLSTLAETVPALALAILFLARLTLGFGESLVVTGALGWGVGLVGPRQTGRVMIWVGMGMYAALAADAPLGTALLARWGFAAVAALVVAANLVGAALAWRVPTVATVAGARLPFYKVVGLVWQPGLGLAACTLGFAALYSFVGLDFAAKGWGDAAFALSLYGIAFLAVRLLFGHLPDRFGGAPLALVTLPVQILGQLLLWRAWTPAAAYVGAALMGAGYSLTFPALGLAAVRPAPPQNRGAAMSAYMAFLDIGLGISGPATGLTVALAGYPSGFLFAALTSCGALAIAWRLAVRPPPASQSFPR